MKLEYIIFYTSHTIMDKVQTLIDNLQKLDIQSFWNPVRENLPFLSSENTLIVSDTTKGVHFAMLHGFPYIQQWVPEQSESKVPAPVCYYDQIEALTCQYLIDQWKRAHHIPLIVAKSKNLYLKELSIEDFEKLYFIRQEDAMCSFLPPLESLSEEIQKHIHYIRYQYEFFDYGLWGVYLTDDTLIGQAGIQNIEYRNQTMLELSYLIAPEFQHKGYASEAILSIYEYVVSKLEQNQLLAIIAKNNLPSIRTAMNLGLKPKEAVTHHGFHCNYYINDDLKVFLLHYKEEKRRSDAAKSALRKAMKHPVQEVYSRHRK